MGSPLKIVVAFKDNERGCLAEEGELLVAASPGAKAEVKLRERDHFFVGLNSGKPSLYGRVELAPEFLTVGEIITRVQTGPGRMQVGATVQEVTRQVELTLSAVRDLNRGVPVVADFTERRFDDKTLVQTVHRVFLRGKKGARGEGVHRG